MNFSVPLTFKFNGWPRKTVVHLFYAMSSFLHYFKLSVNSNGSYSSETPNSGQNRLFFCLLWHWNLTDDLDKQLGTSSLLLLALCIISYPTVNSNWRNSPERPNSGQNRQFFVSCDLEIWQRNLKINIAPVPNYFKLCASFRSHWWI